MLKEKHWTYQLQSYIEIVVIIISSRSIIIAVITIIIIIVRGVLESDA